MAAELISEGREDSEGPPISYPSRVRGRAPSSHSTPSLGHLLFIHLLKRSCSVDLALADPTSLLVFSGGQTRANAIDTGAFLSLLAACLLHSS